MEIRAVTEYIDYRVYLGDYYAYQKKKSAVFSHRYFAQAAGISSSSFLRRVIDGERNLTRPMIDKFSKALKLTEKEATYFKNLVLFNQAKVSSEKSEYYAILRSLKGVVKETVLQTNQFDYFKNWYTPVIRELITLCHPKIKASEIGAMIIPPISASEAKYAINTLLELGLITLESSGGYIQTDQSVIADSAIQTMAVRRYTDSMLKHGRAALEMSRDVRHISTMTLGVSEPQYAALCEELNAFKDRVKQIVTDNDNASMVYELNFELFPVSKSVKIAKGGKDV
ncbi:MAG: TIGR02147 family protein [Fibrobacterales bacterium]